MNEKPLQVKRFLSERRRGFIELIKFGLVGIVNTGVDFAVFYALVHMNIYYLAAQPIAYGAGILNSYIMNKFWTFRVKPNAESPSPAVKREFIRFLVLNLGTLLLSIVLLSLFKNALELTAVQAKVGVTFITVAINFIGSKLWVFRK